MSDLNNKVAIVTGGSRGIGKSISEKLENQGCRVVTVQRSKDTQFDSVQADLFEPEAPDNVVKDVISRFGQVDIIINNAGMMKQESVENLTLEEWNRTLYLNLTAPFLLIKASLEELKKNKGCIVNIGSIEGLASNPMHLSYCTTKAGIHAMTRSIAVDYGKYGIRCNAVAPGWIDTELNKDMMNSSKDPDKYQRDIESLHPIGRLGSAEDVASLVTHLCKNESSFITGQVISVDGGRMSKLSLPHL